MIHKLGCPEPIITAVTAIPTAEWSTPRAYYKLVEVIVNVTVPIIEAGVIVQMVMGGEVDQAPRHRAQVAVDRLEETVLHQDQPVPQLARDPLDHLAQLLLANRDDAWRGVRSVLGRFPALDRLAFQVIEEEDEMPATGEAVDE